MFLALDRVDFIWIRVWIALLYFHKVLSMYKKTAEHEIRTIAFEVDIRERIDGIMDMYKVKNAD